MHRYIAVFALKPCPTAHVSFSCLQLLSSLLLPPDEELQIRGHGSKGCPIKGPILF